PLHFPPLPSLREVLRIYGLRAQKQLSQNFLLQPASLNSFVKCAGSLHNAYVLEVGPGPGGLTRTILQCRPRHLAVVEVDRRFIPGLEELRMTAAEMGIKMDIYRQDILQFTGEAIFPIEACQTEESWGATVANSSGDFPKHDTTCGALACPPPLSRVRVIGNLPFNISTPLVIRWLHDISEHRGIWRLGRVPMIFTFQKEVGQRLVADVWDEQRSRLSIMAQAYCEVKFMEEIRGSAFLPRPQVDAAIVRLVPLSQPLIPVAFPYVEKLVRAAFHFRTKQVVHGLETLFPSNRPELVIRLFKEAGVQPMKRPTQLSILEYRDLCSAYERICLREPEMFGFEYASASNLPAWRLRKHIQREILGSGKPISADMIRKHLYENS
ncbi:ribosomal RNA adenine dimethylase family protein, partial [Opisthorchis viverrini]